MEIFVVGCFLLVVFVACAAAWAAYYNGVTDGYGFSREPENPGYADAGRYLRENMAHRWPELARQERREPS